MSFNKYCLAEAGIEERNGLQAEERRVSVGKAKTTTETVSATIKENEKTIADEVMVELITEELYGSIRMSPDTPLVPGFYQLLLKDGRSYRIVIKGVHPRGRGEKSLVRFLAVPEE